MTQSELWVQYFNEATDEDSGGLLYQVCPTAYASMKNQATPNHELFQTLYKVVMEAAGELTGERLNQELDTLYNDYLSRRFEGNPRVMEMLHGDFKVFSHFMVLHQNPISTDVQPIDINTLWPEGVDASERYNDLIICLLKYTHLHFFVISSKHQNFKQLEVVLERYERLLHLCLPNIENAMEAPQEASLLDFFISWLCKLLARIKFLIEGDKSPEDPLFASVTARFFKVMKTLNLSESPQHVDMFRMLREDYYEYAKRYYELKSLKLNDWLSSYPKEVTAEPSEVIDRFSWRYFRSVVDSVGVFISHKAYPKVLGWGNYLKGLKAALQFDLENINQWGIYSFRVILTSQSNDAIVLGDYLRTYQSTNERLMDWLRSLYELRFVLEQKLRDKETPSYLDDLNLLDTILVSIDTQASAIRNGWLQASQEHTFINATLMQQASECFRILHSPQMKNLSWVTWVHHTCYAFRQTERVVSYEMGERNRASDVQYFRINDGMADYNLETAYTMSDFVIDQLANASRAMRQLLVKVHPDKFPPALKEIAEFCSNEVVALRKNAEHIMELWRRGQWNGLSRAVILILPRKIGHLAKRPF